MFTCLCGGGIVRTKVVRAIPTPKELKSRRKLLKVTLINIVGVCLSGGPCAVCGDHKNVEICIFKNVQDNNVIRSVTQ